MTVLDGPEGQGQGQDRAPIDMSLTNVVRGLFARAKLSEAPDVLAGFTDVSRWEREVVERVLPYTMTSPDRVLHLMDTVRYLHSNAISGAIVECGVWRGGSMMGAALTLVELGDTGRELFLLDTFEGMPPPQSVDARYDGDHARDLLSSSPRNVDDHMWGIAPLEAVQANLRQTGYPAERMHFVKGLVEETLGSVDTGPIALLRLDTDWYESTKAELTALYPRVVKGGVVILDDYGWWMGSRKAVDEYFESIGSRPLLTRLDRTGGRSCVKW